MKHFLFIFIVLLFVGCNKENLSPTESNNPKIGEPFDLKVGSSVSIEEESLTLQFVNVPSDSRCPEGAICRWEGNAMLEIKINDFKDTLNTNEGPSELIYDSFIISLSKLSPYPKSDIAIDSTQYVGQFVVNAK